MNDINPKYAAEQPPNPPLSDSNAEPVKDESAKSIGPSLGATFASTIIPGLGLIFTRSKITKILGCFLVILTLCALATIGYLSWTIKDNGLVSYLLLKTRNPSKWLLYLAVLIAIIGLLWAIQIIGTNLLTRPKRITKSQRIMGSAFVGLMVFIITFPVIIGSRSAMVLKDFMSKTFPNNSRSQTRPEIDMSKADIWEDIPRVNILLAGADTSALRSKVYKERRDGALLTDSMMVASIDTKTGNTTLIQIPRNLTKVPFPKGTKLHNKFPDGYWDGRSVNNEEYLINTLWERVNRELKNLVPNSDFPGPDALKLAVGEITGLKIHYFLALNLDGMAQLIDSLGGIDVNVNYRIQMGTKETPGEPLMPGPNQHLEGDKAMWFIRSREPGDDFSRMARQSCAIKAMMKKIDPVNLLQRYEDIANASHQMIMTDIPQNVLPGMAYLALKMKQGSMNRVLLRPSLVGFNPRERNAYQKMYKRMPKVTAEAIGEESQAKPSASPSPAPTQSSQSPKTTQHLQAIPFNVAERRDRKPSPDPDPTKSTESHPTMRKPGEDLSYACEYHPENK